MSALLSTLPGGIPGLLRSGSLLRHNGRRAVAVQVIEGFVLVAHHATGADEEIEIEGGTVPWDLVALDLTDPTGRVHTAWWCDARLDSLGRERGLGADALLELASAPEWYVCGLSQRGEPMTPEQIDTLARLVLRLAGRQP